MKIVHFDFSLYLEDGSAFGKATVDVELNVLPKVGDAIPVAMLADRALSEELQRRIDGAIKFVVEQFTPLQLKTEASSPDILLCALKDVVVDSCDAAMALFQDLASIGFDCDIWSS